MEDGDNEPIMRISDAAETVSDLVRVAPSTKHGFGVFARKYIPTNTFLDQYAGKIILNEDTIDPLNEYIFEIYHFNTDTGIKRPANSQAVFFVDAENTSHVPENELQSHVILLDDDDDNQTITVRDTNTNWTRYINAVLPHEEGLANVEFFEKDDMVFARSITNINEGEELLVSYGTPYWLVDLTHSSVHLVTFPDDDEREQNRWLKRMSSMIEMRRRFEFENTVRRFLSIPTNVVYMMFEEPEQRYVGFVFVRDGNTIVDVITIKVLNSREIIKLLLAHVEDVLITSDQAFLYAENTIVEKLQPDTTTGGDTEVQRFIVVDDDDSGRYRRSVGVTGLWLGPEQRNFLTSLINKNDPQYRECVQIVEVTLFQRDIRIRIFERSGRYIGLYIFSNDMVHLMCLFKSVTLSVRGARAYVENKVFSMMVRDYEQQTTTATTNNLIIFAAIEKGNWQSNQLKVLGYDKGKRSITMFTDTIKYVKLRTTNP